IPSHEAMRASIGPRGFESAASRLGYECEQMFGVRKLPRNKFCTPFAAASQARSSPDASDITPAGPTAFCCKRNCQPDAPCEDLKHGWLRYYRQNNIVKIKSVSRGGIPQRRLGPNFHCVGRSGLRDRHWNPGADWRKTVNRVRSVVFPQEPVAG